MISSVRRCEAVVIFMVAWAFGAVSGCKTTSNRGERGQVKFGHTVGWQNNTIAAIAPGETLYLCLNGAAADAAPLAERALKEWLAAGGMSAAFKHAVGCGKVRGEASIFLQHGGCTVRGAWAETMYIAPKQWTMKFCFNDSYSYDLVLHEMGHVFGQCDRYGSITSFSHPARGGNCSWEKHTTDGVFNAPSAMQNAGDNHPNRVTEDDARGVIGLLNRTDVLGADEWRKVIKGGGKAPAETVTIPEQKCDSVTSKDVAVKVIYKEIENGEMPFELVIEAAGPIMDKITEVRYDVKEWWGADQMSTSNDKASKFSSGVYKTYGRSWTTNGTEVVVGSCVLKLSGTRVSW